MSFGDRKYQGGPVAGRAGELSLNCPCLFSEPMGQLSQVGAGGYPDCSGTEQAPEVTGSSLQARFGAHTALAVDGDWGPQGRNSGAWE